jgi:nitroreductase
MLALLVSVSRALSPIVLLPADTARGLVYGKILGTRHSERNFKSTPLPLQDLSDLVWAANGVNRPATGQLTIPTAKNAQDISVYVALPDAIYLYDNQNHVLNPVVAGDFRADIASTQPFVTTAPVVLLFVSDYSKFTGLTVDEAKRWSALDAGIAIQTALLWAVGNGYITVPRAYMDTTKLSKAIGLKDTQILHLNLPVGRPA